MRKNTILLIIIVAIAAIGIYGAFYLKQNKILETQVDNLSKENEQFKGQLKKVRDIIRVSNEEINRFKESLKERERQEIQLKEEAAQAQAEAGDLEKEIIRFKESVKRKMERDKQLKEEAAQAQAEIRGFRKEIKKFNKKFKVINAKKTSLEKENSKINKTLQHTTKKLLYTQKDLKALERKLSKINSRDIKPLRREVKQLSESLRIRDKGAAVREVQLQDVTKRYVASKESNNSLKDQVAQLESDKLFLRGESNEISEQFSQQKELISSLKEDVDSINDMFTQKSLELDKKEKEALVLKDEISHLRSKMIGLETKLTITREHYKSVIEDFSKLSQLNTALQEGLDEFSEVLEQEEADKKKAKELKRRVEVILESVEAVKEE